LVKKFYLKRFVAVFMFFVVLTTSIIVPVQKAKAFVVVDDAAAYVLVAAIATACGYEVATSGVGEQITDAILDTDLGRAAWDNLSAGVKLGVGGAYIIDNAVKNRVVDMANAIKAYFGDTGGEKTVNSDFNTADFSQMYDYNALNPIYYNSWVGNVPIVENTGTTSGYSFPIQSLPDTVTLNYTMYHDDYTLEDYTYTYSLSADAIASGQSLVLDVYSPTSVKVRVRYSSGEISTSSNPPISNVNNHIIAWSLNGFNMYNTTISIFLYQQQFLYSIDQLLESRFNDFLNALGELDDIIVRPVSGVTDYGAQETPIDTDTDRGMIGVAVPSDYVAEDTGTGEETNTGEDTGENTALSTAIIGTGSLDFSGFIGITLKDVFPFCIPFDLVECVSQLVAAPKAPCFTVDFSGTAMASAGTVTLDLARFEGLAKIVRYFVFLGFIVGLIMITRNLIRG